ncbi:hypothetical protein HPB50_015832 [Hyalomma asiaticum]|uniref:Uncharacterized protein n=1 Tax=Hyalomma asiaticum TaxID=266040 RepID=A0ACB7TAC7_HYAAI|nr:hypothetical protein HPB50_015832 [Hyalomma asiaticum]
MRELKDSIKYCSETCDDVKGLSKEIAALREEPDWPHHSTDVQRLRVLLRHGGIYLDADVFVVQSLRRFLRYEATAPCGFGNMIFIAHKNSRFLRLFMETYRE